jgi:hypothetical protein
MNPQYNAFVTSSMATIRASIQGDIDKANAAIRSAVDGLNTATPFGGDIQVPQFDIPSLGSMDGLQLPDTFTNALTSFRDTLPTSGQLKDRITDLYLIFSLAMTVILTICSVSTHHSR